MDRSDARPAPVASVIADRQELSRHGFCRGAVEYVRGDRANPRLMQARDGAPARLGYSRLGWRRRGRRSTPSLCVADSCRGLFAACELQSSTTEG